MILEIVIKNYVCDIDTFTTKTNSLLIYHINKKTELY